MRNTNYKMCELKNVDYTDRTNVIGRLLARGYSLEDIVITRMSARTYNISARKEIQ